MMGFEELEMEDQKLYRCLEAEEHRQQDSLEMIASESIQPKMALNLAGSIFNLMASEQCSDAVIERVKERALALAEAFPIKERRE